MTLGAGQTPFCKCAEALLQVLVQRGGGGGERDKGKQLLTRFVGPMQDRSLESEDVCKATAYDGPGAPSLALSPSRCVT